MLKKFQTAVIAVSLIAIAVPAFAVDGQQYLYQDGEFSQLHILPADVEVEFVSGLNDADFDYFDTQTKICAADALNDKIDVLDSDEAAAPYIRTSH